MAQMYRVKKRKFGRAIRDLSNVPSVDRRARDKRGKYDRKQIERIPNIIGTLLPIRDQQSNSEI